MPPRMQGGGLKDGPDEGEIRRRDSRSGSCFSDDESAMHRIGYRVEETTAPSEPHKHVRHRPDVPNGTPTGMSHPAPSRNPHLPPASSILRVSDLTLSGSPENRTLVGSMLPMMDILSLIDSTALRMSTSVSQENATHPVSAILSSLSFVFLHMWTTKSFPDLLTMLPSSLRWSLENLSKSSGPIMSPEVVGSHTCTESTSQEHTCSRTSPLSSVAFLRRASARSGQARVSKSRSSTPPPSAHRRG